MRAASSRRKKIVRILLFALGVPVALALVVIAWFYGTFYAPDRANGEIVTAGHVREYLLHVPASYEASRATPLVISLHAAALWPATQMEISRWNELAEEHGFLVVYPSGTTLRGGGTGVLPKVWLLRPEANAVANVRFVSELIDTLEAAYNIDPARIYVNGFSNGGAMAFALSCRLSGRIAAVGTVSAAQDQLAWSWCGDARPMPFINFHGTADPVPYHGGRTWGSVGPLPDVPEWTASWARRNGCAPTPAESRVAEDATRREYASCARDAAVVLYTLEGGGHNWPGGKPLPEWLWGPTNRNVDATALMWSFFYDHPLPRDP